MIPSRRIICLRSGLHHCFRLDLLYPLKCCCGPVSVLSALIDKTMFRLKTTKLHTCRERGKKRRRHAYKHLSHRRIWSFDYEHVPRRSLRRSRHNSRQVNRDAVRTTCERANVSFCDEKSNSNFTMHSQRGLAPQFGRASSMNVA